MKYRLLFLTAFLLLGLVSVSGQYYDTGQDPASVRWMQIKTGSFTVIYPESFGSQGEAFAKALDQAYSKLTAIFPEKKIRIPVVIHSLTTESNGYVVWAPKRMEIYPTPEQNTIPMDPYEQLAVHELAHVFQMEMLNSGFSKIMRLLLGEQFAGVSAFLLPMWFLEGNAVFAETYLSESGRGRSPSFQKQVKAATTGSGSFYSYDKSVNGSFRDFVPDHYQYGYQMVTWALARYDPQIWNKVLKTTADKPFLLNPVNISLSKNEGLTKKRLYHETFDSLRAVWTKETSENKTVQYESVNPEKNGKFINYYSPITAGHDSILAIRTSLALSPAIVLINPTLKTEEKIHIPGQMYPWLISYARGKVVWVETKPDPRWENRDYSVIRILDLKTRVTKQLSSKSRYLSAAISPDGKMICAVENTVRNINNLVIINAASGEIMQSVPSSRNVYLQHPVWAERGDKISFVFLDKEGEGVISWSLLNHSWETLINAGRNDIQSSCLKNDSLFFISSLSGTDNIYLRTPEKKIKCLTRSKFGTSDLSIKGDRLVFSDYSPRGNNISFREIKPDSESDTTGLSPSSFLIDRISSLAGSSEEKTAGIYTPEPYRKWQHLFRFHSWMPFYADIEQIQTDPASVRPGVTLLTQNSLSTLISSIGYEYSSEKNNVFHTRVTWKGWYPVFESQLDYGDDPHIYKSGVTVNNPADVQRGLRFVNTVSLPLQFTSGRFYQLFYPSFSWDYENNYIYVKENNAYDYGQSILTGRLYFSNYHRFAHRDIYPKWGQVADINYSFAPFDKSIYGTSRSVRTALYIPGIFPNNGIKLRFEKEKQDLFSSKISFPRGYKDIMSEDLTFLSADYVFPLMYPDFNVSSLLYLKRIRNGFFYDYGSGTGNYYYNQSVNGEPANYFRDYNEKFRSYGFELLADFYVLRIPYMISAGIQSAWTEMDNKPVISLLFSIEMFGMKIGKHDL